jgi:hypothetical protein
MVPEEGPAAPFLTPVATQATRWAAHCPSCARWTSRHGAGYVNPNDRNEYPALGACRPLAGRCHGHPVRHGPLGTLRLQSAAGVHLWRAARRQPSVCARIHQGRPRDVEHHPRQGMRTQTDRQVHAQTDRQTDRQTSECKAVPETWNVIHDKVPMPSQDLSSPECNSYVRLPNKEQMSDSARTIWPSRTSFIRLVSVMRAFPSGCLCGGLSVAGS